jgi:hypothetical protein
VGRGVGGSWSGEGGLWARARPIWKLVLSHVFPMNPELSLTWACLNFPLRDKIPKKSFWGCWGARVLFFSESALSWQGGSRSYLQEEIISPTFSLGAHLTQGVWIIVQHNQNSSLMEIFIYLFYYFIIHMCIQSLGHFFPLPPAHGDLVCWQRSMGHCLMIWALTYFILDELNLV